MTDNNDDKTLNAPAKKTLTLKPGGMNQGTVRQDMGRGRTNAVVVETRKRRPMRPEDEKQVHSAAAPLRSRRLPPQQRRVHRLRSHASTSPATSSSVRVLPLRSSSVPARLRPSSASRSVRAAMFCMTFPPVKWKPVAAH